jgi:rubrerythrin
MSKTKDNLKSAFAGESQANRKYLAFAKKAERDGYSEVAKLFKAAAEAETIHAHNHLRIMGGINSTEENLKEALEGEKFEFTEMYPEYIEDSKKENEGQATWSFDIANQVEKVHAELYNKAMDAVKAGNDLPETTFYVCRVCGNTVENDPPEICPVCNAKKSAFYIVE